MTSRYLIMEVHPAEKQLIEYIRAMGYGTIKEVTVHQGIPVEILEAEKKIRLKKE